MTREIKFRGQTWNPVKDNKGRTITTWKSWVYGDLLHRPNGVLHILTLNEEKGVYENHVINPDTVGQFTGLRDKNKIEIFEHDLVECAGVLCEVVYSDKIGSFVLLEVLSQNLGNKPIGQMIDMFGIRYVGNIYDSPELMKQKQL